MNSSSLEDLLKQIRHCRFCTDLPLGPNPMIRATPTSKILIVGQAPGTRVHETGIPWNDRSGDRLRSWLNLDRNHFYDERNIAIMPMGFCYPGANASGGDNPPRKVCAPKWHSLVLSHLHDLQLILLIGRYAQHYYLGKAIKPRLEETIQSWEEYGPLYFPLPHPSWRNTGWIRRNPWFEADIIPVLRQKISLTWPYGATFSHASAGEQNS